MMACAVCCCVSCHTSSGAPVFCLAAGARCRGWGGPEGRAKCAYSVVLRVSVEMSSLSTRQNTPLAATRNSASDDMSAFDVAMGWSPCASSASSARSCGYQGIDLGEKSQAAKRTRYGVQEMPLVLARPCFFPLAQRPDVHYLADASKSPTAPRDRPMAPVPDSTQCTRKPRRRAGRRAQLG